jgi:Bacterial toxin 5
MSAQQCINGCGPRQIGIYCTTCAQQAAAASTDPVAGIGQGLPQAGSIGSYSSNNPRYLHPAIAEPRDDDPDTGNEAAIPETDGLGRAWGNDEHRAAWSALIDRPHGWEARPTGLTPGSTSDPDTRLTPAVSAPPDDSEQRRTDRPVDSPEQYLALWRTVVDANATAPAPSGSSAPEESQVPPGDRPKNSRSVMETVYVEDANDDQPAEVDDVTKGLLYSTSPFTSFSYRKGTYRTQVARVIASWRGEHPLQFLVTARGTLRRSRGARTIAYLNAHPEIVEAGHARSDWTSPGENPIVVMTAYVNQTISRDVEGRVRGAFIALDYARDIGGVLVEQKSANAWVSKGWLDKSVVDNAPKVWFRPM